MMFVAMGIFNIINYFEHSTVARRDENLGQKQCPKVVFTSFFKTSSIASTLFL